MVKHDALLRIFWPLDAIKPDISGVLIGWQNSSSDFLVVSVLENAETKATESALRSGAFFRGSPYPIQSIFERCGNLQLQVLGLFNPSPRHALHGSRTLVVSTRHGTRIPRIAAAEITVLDVQLVMFKRPRPVQMQYMSLQPVFLALTQNLEKMPVQGMSSDESDAADHAKRHRVQQLAKKLQLHTVTRAPLTLKEAVLPTLVNQINCCFELDELLQRNISLVRGSQPSALGTREWVAESVSNLWESMCRAFEFMFSARLYQAATRVFIYILMAIRIIGEVIIIVAGWKFQTGGLALKDISATAQQLDLRLQQFSYWPVQYMTLRERQRTWKSITDNHTEYIRFFNSLWLVANDMIMGMAIGSFVLLNANVIAFHVNAFIEAWSTSGLHQSISWLTRNPGGLKLNNELAQFLGNLFQWVIEYWASSMGTLQPSFPQLIRLIGFASFGGATMPIAMCSDLLSLLTLHIHSFYVASARIYHWQLLTIYSLFHLFRGKKRNVLRNRIDSCDYELDQLLLGTVLFTLLSFLLPTVLVFYSTFAFARSAIIVVKAALDTILAALNHFPLFALMLRVKDSGRLPGGVLLELLVDSSTVEQENSLFCTTSHISLKSTPLPVRTIFHEYSEFGNRIGKHYSSLGFFSSFATGRFVPSLHRKNLYGLQYSILPARRIGIKELWQRLNHTKRATGASISSSNGLPGKPSANMPSKRLG